ncbi:hypothetical protein HPB50_023688 [Hyalomma asiaticum]|uniref:Uncharacterized protein n=1 Tax=Hyalomma asiaticum TaxID=266040 RepID=A0ACB7T2Z0_HYAAI|nr:hypothetical protein HPB50_023688 [Hyalomma asiaticum]
MFLLSSDIDEISRSKLVSTVEFVKRMSRLIAVMTSRCPRDGLRPSSDKVAEIEAFLLFMDHWKQQQIRPVVDSPPKSGNSPAELVRALLDTSSPATSDAIFGIRDIIEDMLEVGNVDGVRSALQSLSDEHSSCVIQKSDGRLTYYVAGYVAKKFSKKSSCSDDYIWGLGCLGKRCQGECGGGRGLATGAPSRRLVVGHLTGPTLAPPPWWAFFFSLAEWRWTAACDLCRGVCCACRVWGIVPRRLLGIRRLASVPAAEGACRTPRLQSGLRSEFRRCSSVHSARVT